MFNLQSLQPGLHGYLIRFAPLAFIPHRQNCSCNMPSPIVSPHEIRTFYRYLERTCYISQSPASQYFAQPLD